MILGTKIENLNKKSLDIVEEKKAVTKLSEINASDRSTIEKMLESPLLDEDDGGTIQSMGNALASDMNIISERMEENEFERKDALGDVDSMMEVLKGNLDKLEKIRETSDLVASSINHENTQSRIADLRRIRELLEGEDESGNVEHVEQRLGSLQSDSINEFKERLKTKDVESVKHDYVLGILASNVNFTNEYKRILNERYASGEKMSREVFDVAVHKKLLSVVDGDWQGGAHYYPLKKGDRKKGVYYNARVDELDEKKRGKVSTFFHEIGHMIDHSFGGDKFISSSEDFLSALNDDLSKIKIKLDADASWKQKFLEMIFADNSAHSISDILEGLTNGAICGRFGHMGGDINYWNKDKYRICNESFAHFFEASMGGGAKLRRIKICFPSAFKEFEKMLTTIAQKHSEELTRIRERSLYDEG